MAPQNSATQEQECVTLLLLSFKMLMLLQDPSENFPFLADLSMVLQSFRSFEQNACSNQSAQENLIIP